MSVYWYMNANGKLTLVGNWMEEAVNAFEAVAEAWEMVGDEKYGIWECGELSESLSAKFSASFGSYDYSTFSSNEYGWYEFSEALHSLDAWTRAWIKNTPKHKGKPIHPLSTAQYDLLLNMMYDNNLSIGIEFEEDDYGEEELIETDSVGILTSDGSKLIYQEVGSELKTHTWKEYGKTAFYGAVDFFLCLVEDADEPKIRKWVKKNIAPTNVFETFGEIDFDTWLDYYAYNCPSEIIDAIEIFFHKFSPGTDMWDKLFEIIGEDFDPDFEPDEESDDDSEDLEDGSDDEDWDDEPEEEDDDEPEYPTEEINSLDFQGKRFVLTGEFQNCNESRAEIKSLIEENGGKCTGAVSGKTNFLVLGDFGEIGAQKVAQALEQQEKGNDIKIITESTLFKFLN